MSQVSLSNSKQVFADFSKTQQSSNSLNQSTFCTKVLQIWNRICDLFKYIFCCKSRSHSEAKKPLIASSQSSVAKPSISSSQSSVAKPREGKPLPTDPKKPENKPVPPSVKTDGVDRLSKLPSDLRAHSLGFLDFNDVMAFGQTSRANRTLSQNNAVWRGLIGSHFSEKVGESERSSNEKARFKELAKRVFNVDITRYAADRVFAHDSITVDGYWDSPHWDENYKIPYLAGITTVEKIFQKIAAATGYPIGSIRMEVDSPLGLGASYSVMDKVFCKQIFSELLNSARTEGLEITFEIARTAWK